MMPEAWGLAALFGYALGSIPFGLILTRLAGLDIRRVGSGNTGATNVLRTGRRGLALATLLLDGGKGALAAGLASRYGDWGLVELAGMGAVLGHCFSIWLLGRGGKGVATGLGVFLVWNWMLALACAAIWLATAFLSRRSSLAGIMAFLAAPLLLLVSLSHPLVPVIVVSLVVILRHGGNIRRLIAGTEPRIGSGSATP